MVVESINDIEIIAATPDDAEGVLDVQYKAWLMTYPNAEAGITVGDVEDRFKNFFTPEGIEKRKERYRNPITTDRILVAKVSNHTVGFCIVQKFPEKNQLRAIYVHIKFQRKGVGGKLWKETLHFLNPLKDTYVEVADYIIQAINFYKKLGFVDTERRWSDEKFKMKSGAVIPEMEMMRKGTSK